MQQSDISSERQRIGPKATEDAMRWPLFSWILAGGIFGMFWFLYLSMMEKHWKPVTQYIRRPMRRQQRSLANT
jgi:hypothetical protein